MRWNSLNVYFSIRKTQTQYLIQQVVGILTFLFLRRFYISNWFGTPLCLWRVAVLARRIIESHIPQDPTKANIMKKVWLFSVVCVIKRMSQQSMYFLTVTHLHSLESLDKLLYIVGGVPTCCTEGGQAHFPTAQDLDIPRRGLKEAWRVVIWYLVKYRSFFWLNTKYVKVLYFEIWNENPWTVFSRDLL